MELVKSDIRDSIAIIQISRPEALNALNKDVVTRLGAVLQEVRQSPEVRGVILTGEGEKAFVAGADIKELSSLSRQEATNLARNGQILFKSIEDCPKPVIAVIIGFALGGGCELAMACHMRIATESAKFGQPEVNLGIIPGYGGTQRLPQLVGRGKALELLLTADMITAQEALSVGLVNRVVPTKEEAMNAATAILKKIFTKGPFAVAQVIRSVNAGYGFEEAGYKTEADSFGECAETHDFREGTTAFIEKRKAAFKGN